MAILIVPTSQHDKDLRVPFYILYCLSLLASVLILGVFCLGSLKRHFTIKYLFVALIVNAVFNILPIRSSPHPSFALCVVVAAGTLAGTVMTAGAAAALVFRTWSLVVLSVRISPRVAAIINAVCLVVPALAWTAVFTGIAISTAVIPNNLAVFSFAIVPRSKLDNRAPRVVSLVFLTLVLVFEIWTLIYLLRRTKVVTANTIKDGSPSFAVDDDEPTHRPSTFDRAFNLRVLVFGGWLAASVGMVVTVLVKGRGNAPAIFQSTGGLCASLVFGSQRDVLEYLHLCRPQSSSFPPSEVLSRATRSDFPVVRGSSQTSLDDGDDIKLGSPALGLPSTEGGEEETTRSRRRSLGGGRVGRRREIEVEEEEEAEGGDLSLAQMLESG